MTEQEWNEREYNQQRRSGWCPLRLVAFGAIVTTAITLLKRGRPSTKERR